MGGNSVRALLIKDKNGRLLFFFGAGRHLVAHNYRTLIVGVILNLELTLSVPAQRNSRNFEEKRLQNEIPLSCQMI